MDIKKYNKEFYKHSEKIIHKENKFINDLILNLKLYNSRCLDFGCGSGYWIKSFQGNNNIVYGLDKNDVIMQCQNVIKNCYLIVYDNKKLPFDNDFFEIIYSFWVLQEFLDDEKFNNILSEFKRVLKYNGKLIIIGNVYPDNRILIRETKFGDIFSSQNDASMYRFFKNNSLKEYIEDIDFKLSYHNIIGNSYIELYNKINYSS